MQIDFYIIDGHLRLIGKARKNILIKVNEFFIVCEIIKKLNKNNNNKKVK